MSQSPNILHISKLSLGTETTPHGEVWTCSSESCTTCACACACACVCMCVCMYVCIYIYIYIYITYVNTYILTQELLEDFANLLALSSRAPCILGKARSGARASRHITRPSKPTCCLKAPCPRSSGQSRLPLLEPCCASFAAWFYTMSPTVECGFSYRVASERL
jgi:hypothetical protein